MGKGDKKSRRGKIYRGSYGKTRPRPQKIRRRRAKASKKGKSSK